jgi:integrase
MATIRHRSDRNTWEVTWNESGRRRRRSFRDPGEAEEFRAIRELEERTGKRVDTVTGQVRGQRISEFIEDYLAQHKTVVTPRTFRDDARACRGFAAAFGHLDMGDWSSGIVERHLAARSASVRASTVNRERACILAAYNKAKRWGLVEGSLVVTKRRELDSKVPDYYSQADLERLYEAAEDRAPWWRFMVNTGLRRSEMARARRAWVRPGDQLYVESTSLERTKSGKYRVVPLSPGALQALEALGEDRLLPKMHPDTLTHLFARDAKRAGLPGSLHWLRHTFCSQLINTHFVPAPVVQQLAGHADIKTTMRYVKPDLAAATRGVEGLAL